MTTTAYQTRLAILGLLLIAAAIAVLAPTPVDADGNEGPGAPPGSRGITAGGAHTCAVVARRAVKCWGEGSSGQLGYGDPDDRGDEVDEMGNWLPTVSFGLGLQMQSMSAGAAHTCVRSLEGHVVCWGDNDLGQLGLGDTEDRGDGSGEMGTALPRVDLGHAGGPRFALAVTAGDDHTCALLDTHRVTCWGANAAGQLGQGDTDNRGDAPGEMGNALTPVALGSGRTAAAIAAGGAHTCALLDDGTVTCWGANGTGQLGLGDTNPRGDGPGEMGNALPPIDLGPGRTARALALGSNHTCALLDDGTVTCWGANGTGQLGLGDTNPRGDGPGEMGNALPPIDLGPGRTATGITAGGAHTCALLDDGTVTCWGANGTGQLGLGDTNPRGDGPGEMGNALPAIDLGSGHRADAVTAGDRHTCAHTDDGSVVCWGANGSGQLGQGDLTPIGDDSGEMGEALVPAALGSTCDARPVTVDLSIGQVPTAADDVILGTPAGEIIDGRGGRDRICGRGGPDRLIGGPGHDRLFGQAGNDTLDGGADHDRLDGGDGRDLLVGGAGPDSLDGGPGIDRLRGGTDVDSLDGGPGADRLNGGPRDDRLNGEAGDDLLDAGAGADRLNGGPHRDICHGRTGRDSGSGCEVTTGIP